MQNRSASVNRPSTVKHAGHEALLNHLMRSGKSTTIILTNGNIFTGTIKAFDNYTISLAVDNVMVNGNKVAEDVSVVFFKHAISGFYSPEK